MGSSIEINDTLQITRKQGFPKVLVYERHVKNPIALSKVKNKIFEFKNKKGIRIFQSPPVRNFLVENRNGKWLYWGLIHVIETKHDNVKKTTSGKFKIIYLYNSDEMKSMHGLVDRNKKTLFRE